MEYADNDLWARLERARLASLDGIVKDVRDARENPMYVADRIEEGQEANRRAMAISLKIGYPIEIVEPAMSCVRLLRGLRPLFDTLYEHVAMKGSDEDANDYLIGLTSMDEDDEAVKALLSEKTMPPSRLANFIERWQKHGKETDLRPMQTTVAVGKLRQLENKLKGK